MYNDLQGGASARIVELTLIQDVPPSAHHSLALELLKVPDKVRDAESVPLGHGGVGRPDALLRRAQHLRPMADMVQRLNYRGRRGNRLPSHMVPPSCAMACRSPPARNLGRGCLFHSQYVPRKLDD